MTPMTAPTQYLARPNGEIAFDVSGEGPLVVAIPGMGDVRGSYRFLTPQLVAAGYRVASFDLRGHGDSSSGFNEFDDLAAASDAIALIEQLGGGPAFILGNSMGAAVAAIVAVDRPELVNGLVLIGPFVRNVPMPPGMGVAMRTALMRPWGPKVWKIFHRRAFPAQRPADYDEYVVGLMSSLTRPGSWHAFQRTARTSHQPADDRLDAVKVPVLVMMGSKDPDFKDPAAEANLVTARLDAELFIVESAGHYPHAEFPDQVGPRVLEFLKGIPSA
ncbi:MAG: alpha/beta fold hydrolase [Actinomycetes bacterium]